MHTGSAFRKKKFQMSNQRLGVNQLLGVTPNCWPTNFFSVFLCVPYVSLSCEWWKRYFFTHFRVFLIIFDHVNSCASMRSLVKIHNIYFQFLLSCTTTLPPLVMFLLNKCSGWVYWALGQSFSTSTVVEGSLLAEVLLLLAKIKQLLYTCHQFLQYFILYQLWIVDLKHVLNYSIHSRSKMSMVFT